MSQENCKNCRFFFESKCIFNPPQVFPMPSQNQLTGEVQMQVITLPVQVVDDNWCGRYQPSSDKPVLSSV